MCLLWSDPVSVSAPRSTKYPAEHTTYDLSSELAADGSGGLFSHGFNHALTTFGSPKQIAQCPTRLRLLLFRRLFLLRCRHARRRRPSTQDLVSRLTIHS